MYCCTCLLSSSCGFFLLTAYTASCWLVSEFLYMVTTKETITVCATSRHLICGSMHPTQHMHSLTVLRMSVEQCTTDTTLVLASYPLSVTAVNCNWRAGRNYTAWMGWQDQLCANGCSLFMPGHDILPYYDVCNARLMPHAYSCNRA